MFNYLWFYIRKKNSYLRFRNKRGKKIGKWETQQSKANNTKEDFPSENFHCFSFHEEEQETTQGANKNLF